ncbi:MAG: hypothetical protein KDB37_06740 [Ilumatobacter sp.]|nr:hypothetical protein [Ilumatobacter sp.]
MERESESSTATLEVDRSPEDAVEQSDEAARHVAVALAAGLGAADPRDASPFGGTRGPGVGAPVTMRHIQRLAGNAAAARLASGALVQRSEDDEEEVQLADVSVSGLTLSADTVTLPVAGDLSATAQPAHATGVTYSVAAGSVEPTATTIDASSGAITVGAGQRGGTIEVSADGSDGSGVSVDLTVIERPGAISATATSGNAAYGGQFTHTFTAPSGHASGLEGANINEEFDASEAETPWGNTFQLTANASGSHGWDLDASGKMAGPDNVTIGSGSVDIGRALASTSNPTGVAALPVGFTMTQKLYATVQPGGTREASPFATVSHRRRLIAGPQFEVSAGLGTITEDYTGPGAVTGATPSSSTVMASPPRPATGEWNQRKVTVTATPYPDDTALSYTIRGANLGCTVDADGEVSIGAQAGTITVRVTAAAHNYDETTITITEYRAPSGEGSSTGTAEPGAAPGPAEPAPTPPDG